MKEEWFGTKYRRYKRPDANDLKMSFEAGDWVKIIGKIKKLKKNTYVPEDLSIVAEKRKPENDEPKRIVLKAESSSEEEKLNSTCVC